MSRFREIARILAIPAIVLSVAAVITVSIKAATVDYISYWSAGHLLLQHESPYSSPRVLRLERQQGFTDAAPLMMRNTPWALPLALPLGYGSAPVSMFFWIATLTSCLALSLSLLHTGRRNRLLAYCFMPSLVGILYGQSSPFLLLGFAMFLRFHRTRPVIAGAGLFLMSIKPHLFLAFWLVVLMESLYRRRFRSLIAAALALLSALAIVWHFDHHIWAEYVHMLRMAGIEHELIPTFSTALRFLTARRHVWIQLIPSCLALIWAVGHYLRHRATWDWQIHGMLLMIVAVFVSPYSWITDQVVLLPAVLFALESWKRSTAGFLLINGIIAGLMLGHVPMSAPAYIWTAPAWFFWFLFNQRRKERQQPPERERTCRSVLGIGDAGSSNLPIATENAIR